MFSNLLHSLPSPPKLLSKAQHGDHAAIHLPPVEVHDVETSGEKPARALKHLLKLNHVTFSVLYHDLEFHNHMPHLLCSGYLLGGDADHLNRLYETEAKELEGWVDSPGEIDRGDWRDFLGKKEYQRAFLDFYEDEMVRQGYDWKKVVEEYLFFGEEPLVNALACGLGHPLIHMGYAIEMSNREIAMEALAMASASYDDLHKYIDRPETDPEPEYHTNSPLEILDKVYNDKRLDGVFKSPGGDNFNTLLKDYGPIIRSHWNAWRITDPKKQFEQSQEAAAVVFTSSTEKPNDFFIVHLLTTSHAVRILLPVVPTKFHMSLVRQWFLLVVIVYIAQLRPKVNPDAIKNYDLKNRDWEWVRGHGAKGKWSDSAHFIKAIRALREAANTWGDGEKYYLKAAVKFIDEFDGWGGFGG